MVIRKRLRRAEVHSFLAGLEPCSIGMEAARASGDGGARLAVLPIAICVSRPSSREAAKALIFTPVWETSEGIPVSITRRQFLTNAGISVPGSALVSARVMSMGDRQPASDMLDDWSVCATNSISRANIFTSQPSPLRRIFDLFVRRSRSTGVRSMRTPFSSSVVAYGVPRHPGESGLSDADRLERHVSGYTRLSRKGIRYEPDL